MIPIVTESLLNAPAEAIIRMISKGGTFIPIPAASEWTATNVGTGGGAGDSGIIIPVITGTTANSSALKTIRVYGFASNTTDLGTINWAKKIIIHLPFQRDGSDAEGVARIQIKAVSTIGALADKGIELRMDNLALTGASYGASGADVDLSTTLTAAKTYRLTIIHDPAIPKIEWYIDKLLKGTQSTAAKQPTTTSSNGFLAISSANGATGGVNVQLSTIIGWIWQAF